MDDFVIANLHESRNEWCGRLISIFTPLVIEGVRSIFNESWKLCLENDEANKYLMTFQNLLSRVPKWNNVIVEEERKRIIERSGCNYLEDLISCVHIIQLKVLTCIRVGNKQKKIDISIPKLDTFIHKVYINVARKVYMNVYLFEKNISPLLTQKNNRELETIVQECILMAIRESIPTESIIRAYMDESMEQEEEVIIENIPDEPVAKPSEEKPTETVDPIRSEEDIPSVVPSVQNINDDQVVTRLTFNDLDSMMDDDNNVQSVSAPKSIERLEQISTSRAIQRKLEEESDDEEEERLKISTETIDLSGFDILDDKSGIATDDFMLDGVEELP
jgi:Family of unknown function (DUF5764)